MRLVNIAHSLGCTNDSVHVIAIVCGRLFNRQVLFQFRRRPGRRQLLSQRQAYEIGLTILIRVGLGAGGPFDQILNGSNS